MPFSAVNKYLLNFDIKYLRRYFDILFSERIKLWEVYIGQLRISVELNFSRERAKKSAIRRKNGLNLTICLP